MPLVLLALSAVVPTRPSLRGKHVGLALHRHIPLQLRKASLASGDQIEPSSEAVASYSPQISTSSYPNRQYEIIGKGRRGRGKMELTLRNLQLNGVD